MALKYENFSEAEQQMIAKDWAAMARMAASALGDSGPVARAMRTWFGGADRVVLMNNLRKMLAVIQDANRTFTFVNRTGGVLKVSYNSLLHPQLLPPDSPGNALVEIDGNGDKYGAVAYVFPANRMGDVRNATTLDDLNDLPLSSHVGSGMRLYLTELYLASSDATRAGTLYHELTHKVLACEDYAYDGACLGLSDARKLRNADNYRQFVEAL